jgi:starch phosphorylase
VSEVRMAIQNKSVYDKLSELGANLWWSWQPEVTQIFRDLDHELWTEVGHNPLRLVRTLGAERVERQSIEGGLSTRINWAYRRWREYMESCDTWGATHAGVLGQRPTAYFSAEFGIHESLPIYSGGLGVLAGDHLKSSSDLGVPLVAVGLFYSQGYFHQSLDGSGWQQESYPDLNPAELPMVPALDRFQAPVLVQVDTRHGPIFARVWRVEVGRISLFLLDANVPQNSEEDRRLTSRLYGGDQRTRIRQEILLGIGGLRALAAVGILPGVIHMNEGHSAFAALEAIRQRMNEDAQTFDASRKEVSASSVFTTHTPVPAGHDRFGGDLMQEHLGPLADQLGLSHDALMGLGRVDPNNHEETFCMTVLALKLTGRANAVSSLHGVVSRRMWASLWPWSSEEEIPIGHITNGVHVSSWLAGQMRMLYDRVLPLDWYLRSGEPEVWAPIEHLTPGELWETHQSLKNRLIAYVRRRLQKQARRIDASEQTLNELAGVLDPRALTIGFARRFALYKRADLIFRDLDELGRIVASHDRPVQFIFAGKSHPADNPGKQILQRVFQITRQEAFRGRVVFLDDYDINLARHLVQGVDVWLNNPRRPLEASGTSGQKVVLNGVLNLSILDGWWAEAYDGSNGFAIGNGRTHVDQNVQDARDAESLVHVLRDQVVPLFFDRDHDDLPQRWIRRMKRAVRTLGWRFNADRMVMDYVREGYVPAAGGVSCLMNK